MNWPALFALLIKFLPTLAELLSELFAKARPAGTPAELAPRDGITAAFAAARAQTWVWQLGIRARLRAAERIATHRADELYVTLRFGTPAPVLTRAERDEIERA